jgi:hypothetical protein
MRKNKTANPWIGLAIIVAIAIVQGVGFGQAFVLLDARGVTGYPAIETPVMIIAGLILGLAVEGGIAYIASKYLTLTAKRELRIIEASAAALLMIAPLVLTPVRLFTMDTALKASLHPWIAAGLVFLLSGAPSIVTIAVAIVDRDALLVTVVHATAPPAQATAPAAPPAPAIARKREATAPAAPAVVVSDYPRKCAVVGCDYELRSKQAVGPHMRARHPELCVKKMIPMPILAGRE